MKHRLPERHQVMQENMLLTVCSYWMIQKMLILTNTRSTPKLEKRQVIADFFGVSLEYLNTGKESSSEYSLDSSLLFGQIRRDERLCNALTKYFELPDDGKEKILNVLETMINGEK